MGTRGTLRVYLNDELKVRQYNQWDSYPTGQFADICEFMSDEEKVKKLAGRLSESRFFTKEEWEKVARFMEDGVCSPCDTDLVSLGATLLNRDYGANILDQILCMCRYDRKYLLPDWAMVFNNKGDLYNQEGNYEIHIWADISSSYGWVESIDNVRFKLNGDWHGIKRHYKAGYIPTAEEMKKWDDAGNC